MSSISESMKKIILIFLLGRALNSNFITQVHPLETFIPALNNPTRTKLILERIPPISR
jgi:hypothetical protein